MNLPIIIPGMYQAAIEMAQHAAKEEGHTIDQTQKIICLAAPNGDHRVLIPIGNNQKFEIIIENQALYEFLKAKQ